MVATVNGYATTRASLLRGSSTDEYGDEVDVNDPVVGWTTFPASLIEGSRNVQDPSSGTWSVVAITTARVPVKLPVQDGDRLRDLRSGITYAIDDFSAVPHGVAGYATRKMTLRQIDA